MKAEPEEHLTKLKEIEELLRFPGVAGHLARAGELALSIARTAPTGTIANLAMQLISEASALRPSELPLRPDDGRLNTLLWRLRLALQEAKNLRLTD